MRNVFSDMNSPAKDKSLPLSINKRALGCGLLSLMLLIALCFIVWLMIPQQTDQRESDLNNSRLDWPTPMSIVTPSPDDLVWTILGGLGSTQYLTGTVAVNPDGANRIFMQVSGLGPFSPNSRARSIHLKVNCTLSAGTAVQWHYEPFNYQIPDSRSEDFVCGDSTSIIFSYDANYHWLVFDPVQGVEREIDYKLTATVHSPY